MTESFRNSGQLRIVKTTPPISAPPEPSDRPRSLEKIAARVRQAADLIAVRQRDLAMAPKTGLNDAEFTFHLLFSAPIINLAAQISDSVYGLAAGSRMEPKRSLAKLEAAAGRRQYRRRDVETRIIPEVGARLTEMLAEYETLIPAVQTSLLHSSRDPQTGLPILKPDESESDMKVLQLIDRLNRIEELADGGALRQVEKISAGARRNEDYALSQARRRGATSSQVVSAIIAGEEQANLLLWD